jgi:cation transport ATPase
VPRPHGDCWNSARTRWRQPSAWPGGGGYSTNSRALIYLLLFALVVDLFTWARAGAARVPIEALAVAAVLLLNVGLGLLQEYRSERALEELARRGAPKAWVLRDGVLSHRDVAGVVVGEVVRLEAGDRVPAATGARHGRGGHARCPPQRPGMRGR